jgi:predicted RNA-binding Zn-ribbon protein involved in translation (DUF1610 family)
MKLPHSIELADVLRVGFPRYLATAPLLPAQHYKVVNAIMACHTSSLGGHIYRCDQCGHDLITYNSCRNRHCPSCQAAERAKWVEKRLDELLPVPYFHLVFTIPATLNPFALRNKECVYRILFRAASETLHTVAAEPKYLGARQGFIAVLHTWGQNLLDHPHLHVVVPAGGLDAVNGVWKHARNPSFLFPVTVLSALFRGKFMAYFRDAIAKGELCFHGELGVFEQDGGALKRLIDNLYSVDWVVYAKAPFGGPQAVVKYLGRYTHRIAISNQRLCSLTDTHVSFRWKDYAHQSAQKLMTLPIEEFIRRFLLHVLPSGFVRIRYYGFLSQANRPQLDQCMKLLGNVPRAVTRTRPTPPTWAAIDAVLDSDNRKVCPRCGKGHLTLIRQIDAQIETKGEPSRRLA